MRHEHWFSKSWMFDQAAVCSCCKRFAIKASSGFSAITPPWSCKVKNYHLWIIPHQPTQTCTTLLSTWTIWFLWVVRDCVIKWKTKLQLYTFNQSTSSEDKVSNYKANSELMPNQPWLQLNYLQEHDDWSTLEILYDLSIPGLWLENKIVDDRPWTIPLTLITSNRY